ncbi:MAG: zinc ribbon domain-containing protein [Sulfuritalea sp.]|nr:zinc ribbon domain-containing protein [Sulfuritalea sp.]MDP1983486.1 zinc ribbon domain-containing protein [Sulfuritalea sp.]
MTCTHSNPPGYAYCGTCGEPVPHSRCRCGFVAGVRDAYCGRCGAALVATDAAAPRAVMDAERRFDLERLAQLAAQENKFLETTNKARVTQDDIRKLLAKRRKKF